MAYAFACKVLGVKCDWEATGETKDDVMRQVREHANEGAHPISEVVAAQSVRNVGSMAS